MSRVSRPRLIRWFGVSAVLAGLVAGPAEARPLRTGFVDPGERAFGETDLPGAYDAARGAGASVARVQLAWVGVARTPPADPTDPRDPAYDWSSVDPPVRMMVAAGLEPLLSVYAAPRFARVRGPSPRPGDLAAFMTALARRYGGGFVRDDGVALPRVRLFQLWNEPNLRYFLDLDGAPAHYRAMLRAAYPAVHAEHRDNVLVAGGLAPFAGPRGRYGAAPLPFMRKLFRKGAPFDVWAMHPYTSGPPARHAAAPGDVSVGDLPAVRRLLDRRGHRGAPLWATEFSWDSAPPDPFAVPLREHARWVAEGLYRMWRHGVSLVVWFQLRDNPKGPEQWSQSFQSGLYFKTQERYADERAKPALTAFRFPFVALPARGGVKIWGRTPTSERARVAVEVRRRGRWRRVATPRADGDGIFGRRLGRGLRGAVIRARIGGDASLPFVARPTRDRYVYPFGGSRLPPG